MKIHLRIVEGLLNRGITKRLCSFMCHSLLIAEGNIPVCIGHFDLLEGELS